MIFSKQFCVLQDLQKSGKANVYGPNAHSLLAVVAFWN